jgi:hypothetical protein
MPHIRPDNQPVTQITVIGPSSPKVADAHVKGTTGS